MLLELNFVYRETLSMIKTIEDYNKRCHTNLIKQTISVLVYTAKQQANQVCIIQSKRQNDLLDAFPALIKAIKNLINF